MDTASPPRACLTTNLTELLRTAALLQTTGNSSSEGANQLPARSLGTAKVGGNDALYGTAQIETAS